MLRCAAPADSAAMGRIYCEAWKAAYRGIVPDGFLDGLTPEKAAPSPERIRPEGCFVWEHDGEVVGLVNFTSGDMPEIRSIYVLPEFWGAGVGKALFSAAAGAVRKTGAAGMQLWTLTQNARARRFYENQGMRADGERTIEIAGRELSETRYVIDF